MMKITISNPQAAELGALIRDQIAAYISANRAAYIEWLREQSSADCIAELKAIEAAERGEEGKICPQSH